MLIVSCTGFKTQKRFRDIDILMEEHPDSALSIIESIDPETMFGKASRAKYALLYSMALDKNYIDIADDSLISIAIDYYKSRGPKEEKMLSYYYLGRVHANSGNYTKSIIDLTKALQTAEKINDTFNKGMIYQGLADIYGMTFNHTEELHYRKLEYESFTASKAIQNANYSLIGLASSYTCLHEFEKSEKCYKKVIDIALSQQDTTLLCECLLGYAHLLTLKDSPEPEKSIGIYFHIVDSLGFDLPVSAKATLACALHQTGDNQMAKLIINEIRPLTEGNKVLEASIKIDEFNIAYADKDYEDAIRLLNEGTRIQDSLSFMVLNNSIATAQRDYMEKELEYETYLTHSSYIIILLIVTVSILIIVILCYIYHLNIKKKDRELADSMQMLSLAQETTQKYEHTISLFTQRIRQLYQHKFELIGRICQRYYEYENVGTRCKQVYNEVENVINILKDDSESSLLESILNDNKDGIMEKLRSDRTLRLKVDDYRILEYWFAGFPPTVISLLIGKDIGTIYIMRYRLKARIQKSCSPHKELFLNNMLSR